MNLEELVNSIPNSEHKLKENLLVWIDIWKHDSKGIDDLEYLIGKWHGNVWFEDVKVSNKFYEDFCEFREKAINQIAGMTLNERLYWFCLFDLWDSNNPEVQNRIRIKLRVNA